ncbi:BTB/POZ domain-containing protein 9 [Chamberlinius hualienensis]
MSDSHHLGTNRSVGDVEHVYQLSEDIGALYLSNEISDVTIILENTRFYGHKVILAARSEYFRALLFGGMRESQESEIELKGTSVVAFKLLLKYIYTGQMGLASLKEEVILDVLWLAHQYGFVDLETAISDYLKAILSSRNVCVIYDMANLFNLTSLSGVCCSFIDKHATDIMLQESFLSISASALKEIISRNSFCAKEVDIFRAVCLWIEHNPESDSREILSAIRLPLMKINDLLNVVRPTMLFSSDALLDAIQSKTESKDTDLNYRGYLLPEENVATHRHGAQVIRGDMRQALLDGDTKSYDMERGFTRHGIDEGDNNQKGIVIKLGKPCIVNCFKMLLWDLDTRSYSYYIEVSMDQKDWARVVDHQGYLCRSWQRLYFPARVVNYARIVGTHNTLNRVFHLVSFECLYTNKAVKLENGLIVPKENVATIQNSASVIEGVSRSRNALLNGDTQNYDWDSGYTCHQLGSGSIVIQLAQPYFIDSMRLLLWDCDDRSYSYKVEVSIDQCNWDIVHDRTKEHCQSWQYISFQAKPISFFKITGTHNTANEVFHCVHFECPAQSVDNGKLTSAAVKEAM